MQTVRALTLVALAATALFATRNTYAGPGSAPQTLDKGVTVNIVRTASGPKATASSTVTVHYEGTLTNGTVFDSSYKRSAPATFPLRGVVPCWQIAVPHIPVGAKAKVVCSPESAYGSAAVGAIPPNSTLNFDIEVLSIQ